MGTNQFDRINSWISLNKIQMSITNELETILQDRHQLSVREFYVLLFLSQTPEKKLRLQQLQTMVGLSQSAMSRLVDRLEAKSCGVLQKHICKDDRRGVYTALTEQGAKKLEQAIATFSESLELAFSKTNIQTDLQSLIQDLRS